LTRGSDGLTPGAPAAFFVCFGLGYLRFAREIGQNAPAFSSGISFGHEQSNETLKGTDGTVLLFFRSADSLPFCKTAARAAAKCEGAI